MNNTLKEVGKAAITTSVGGALGAGAYGILGGVGVTAVGAAIGITLGPFIGIGAGIGALGYGVYRLGKHKPKDPVNPS
jgi:hypothetical protein